MRRLSFCLAAVVGALVVAPGALAGPSFVSQGGAGVASPDGRFHYVTLSEGSRATLLEKIAVPRGEVIYWIRLEGSWGTPILGSGGLAGQGISRDGRTLVLASTPGAPYASPSRFLVVSLPRLKVVRTISGESASNEKKPTRRGCI
ncbi:MAG TPA: hypothetical protein VE984_00200 [Gaiellaceae bacterium]|nr:hypothetical protein [Gaiellaceae bacterium]